MAVLRARAVAAAFAVAVAVMIGMYAAAGMLEGMRRPARSITVEGHAERPVESDMAAWVGSFSAEEKNLRLGYARLEDETITVRGFLEQLGAPVASMSFSEIQAQPVYRRDRDGQPTADIIGYKLWRSVSIAGSDVQMIERLSRRSAELIRDGINFQSHAPQYFCTAADELKMQLLGEAMQSARQRAELLAGHGGFDIGRLIHAGQGNVQITPPHTTDASFDHTHSMRKVVRAAITAEFTVE